MLPTVLSPGTQARQYAAAPAAAAAFSPLSLSPLAWFDASVANSLFQDYTGTTPATADADPIGLWKDQSGNANNASTATGVTQPTLRLAVKNGKNVVRFDGADDRLATGNLSVTQDWSVFTAALGPGVSAGQVLVTTTRIGSDHGVHFFQDGTTMRTQTYNTLGTPFIALKSVTQNIWALQGSLVSAGVSTCYINGSGGTPTTMTGTPNSGSYPLSLGYYSGIFYFGKDLAEVLFFNSALSTTNRQAVESYLNAKWALY